MTVQDTNTQGIVLLQAGVTIAVSYLIYNNLMRFSFFSNALPMQKTGAALSVLDYGLVFVMIAMFTLSVYLATQVKTSKIFMPASFITLVITTWISTIFSNVWKAFITNSAFSGIVGSLAFTSQILTNLPLLIFAGGMMIIIALYTRMGGGRRAAR